MTLLPVIERELRAEARSAFTYWLRCAGAAALLTAGIVFFANAGLGHMAGGDLFRVLHVVLFVAVWLVATLMTADAISRERREGTLGLLFLTPLRPLDVVLAKGLAHGLRAAGIGLAAVPVLVVPFLMGGVGWREAAASVLINFTALCLALTAGLLASSFCRTMTRALATAVMLETGALVMLAFANGVAITNGMAAGGWTWRNSNGLDDLFQYGWHAMLSPDVVVAWASRGRGIAPAALSAWLWTLVFIAAATLLLCLLAAVLAAQNVRRAARDKGPSVALQKVEKQFCTPTFALGFYRKWMRRLLERNPVGWLERRTWQARLVTWVWLSVMLSVLSWIVSGGFGTVKDVAEPFALLGWALVANIALTAAGSLRRERESGVIELLLVSPLSVRQILGGRLRGITGQFLPAAVLLFGSWLWLLHALSGLHPYADDSGEQLLHMGMLIVTMLTVPVAGLYFSLRCRVFIVAVFWTAAVGLALPWLASSALWMALHPELLDSCPPSWRTGYFWLMMSGAAWLWLRGHRKWAAALTLAAVPALARYLGEAWPLDDEREVPTIVVCAALQTAVAMLLAGLLRRRLERRDFALPQ